MAVNLSELLVYLHEAVGRLVDHRFSSDTDLGFPAPDGVHLAVGSNPGSRRMTRGQVKFDQPVRFADLGPFVERQVEAPDGSLRMLLVDAGRAAGPFGPARVTVALPTTPSDHQELEVLHLAFPNESTSPVGIPMYSTVALRHDCLVDFDAVLRSDSVLRKLADLVDGNDDLTGVRWCADARQLLGGPELDCFAFGMHPKFVPLISTGTDFTTLGLLWDRPETGVLDDTWLYAVSPGSKLGLDSKVRLKGWLVQHIRAELEIADPTRADQLQPVLNLLGRSTKPAGLGFGGGLTRSRPSDLGDGERWVPHVYGGDGERAPAEAFSPKPMRFCSTAWAGVEGAQRSLSDGLAGSALHAASSGLRQAAGRGDGAATHALYHLMADAYDQLERDVLASRCRALTTAAVPMVGEFPQAPPPRPAIFVRPFKQKLPMYGARTALGTSDVLAFDHWGQRIEVAANSFSPIVPSALPGQVLIDLLDSGSLAVDEDDNLTTGDGAFVLGARTGSQLVVGAIIDAPASTDIDVVAVVDWGDDDRRFDVVRYVGLVPQWDPFKSGSDRPLMWFDRQPERTGTDADEVAAAWQAAGPHGAADTTRLDVLPNSGETDGLVVSERAAALLSDEPCPTVSVDVDGVPAAFRYVWVPPAIPIDWDASSFVVVTVSAPTTVHDRPDRARLPDRAALDELNAELAANPPRRACVPHVAVLEQAPTLMRVPGVGLLVRGDIRDQVLDTDLVGVDVRMRSNFYLKLR